MIEAFRGAVLCGGGSTRMGRDKATLEVGGVAMAVRAAGALWDAGASEVVAIGGDRRRLEELGLVVVPDDEPGGGPFPATLTALRRASGAVTVVVSCDLLSPDPRAIRTLLARLDEAAREVLGAVPVADGHAQWTHAAWRPEALIPLDAARRAGAGSLRRAAEGLPLVRVEGLPGAALADADLPRDLPGDG